LPAKPLAILHTAFVAATLFEFSWLNGVRSPGEKDTLGEVAAERFQRATQSLRQRAG
jgi:hypothetical protein